jgi:hypothetical protein
MFRIEYQISSVLTEDLNNLTEDNIRYNFLPGDVCFFSDEEKIEMEWGWIPLLDFAFCLSNIADVLMSKDNANEYFEFTESAETIKFSKIGKQLKIIPSFSSNILNVSFIDFTTEVNIFHSKISKYIKGEIFKPLPQVLKKYIYPSYS